MDSPNEQEPSCVPEASADDDESTIYDKAKRRRWVHPLNMKRLSMGQFHNIYTELRNNTNKFYEYYHMRVKSFDFLLKNIRQHINKKNTKLREAISAEERLTLTLRYLATGKNFSTLHTEFLIGKSTIGSIIRETCIALWNVLQPIEMPTPNEEKWLDTAELFYNRTNFPNCIGAVDGKHVSIKTTCTNKYLSIILIGIADANYCFSMINVEPYENGGDGNIFKQSAMGKQLCFGQFNLPRDRAFPGTLEPLQPYVLVGDEAFPLHHHLVRPFPSRNATVQQRIFNFRLNRARRYAECAFSLLSNRWPVFQTSLQVEPDFVVDIVKAACVLHNFVRRRDGYMFEDILSCSMQDIQARGTGSPSPGRMVRQQFAEYFESDAGSIPWQSQRINHVT